ncbi:39S ribosomal protein L16, mitochondrial-like [Haliotis rufescens]|uniref:39S ribosomal protein L16, mitochondrial-like n=1 Tax=Haliotis rufescens TaxID=6454 RepID=UPI001EB0128B|nr:39S ribosomal protein L16, mitochondrial-like [Haliotis rufescens]
MFGSLVRNRNGLSKLTDFGISSLKSFKGLPCAVTQVATLMKLEDPPTYDHVEFPERKRLRFYEKVPQLQQGVRAPKTPKDLHLMRGPDKLHNKLQYGQYGIQALTGGRLRWGHYEALRLTIGRRMDESRMFAIWRIDQPWKSVSKKGIGTRMGGGKGNIDHYVYPLRANRILLEMGGKCEFKEVEKILKPLAKIMPFRARVVSHEILAEEAKQEAFMKRNNINPFTFQHCAQHNFLGCRTWMSPYDFQWHGKYR